MDKLSDESTSSESTFNEDLGNINEIIQSPVLQTEQSKPINKQLKVRQLLTLSDEKDYELDNPRENKNYNYFGEVKPIAIDKNLTPLKVYIYGNYPHFQKSTTYFMLRKAGVEINNKLIGK